MVDKQNDLGFQMRPRAEKTIREWLKKISKASQRMDVIDILAINLILSVGPITGFALKMNILGGIV